jgi:hypothetical protein
MVWLHVISDGLITLSYYGIPVVLIYFVRKNRDLPFNRIFWMFATALERVELPLSKELLA